MAQFRAIIDNGRTQVSRLGHKTNGLRAVLNGWHKGVEISAYYDKENDKDIFRVYKTGGSTGATSSELIAEISE